MNGAEYYQAETLTTSSTTQATKSVQVDYLAFANFSASDVTVTVQDGNGKYLVPGMTIQAATLTIIPMPEGGLFFKNGVSWKASADSAVDAWMRTRS